jgi:hypothetical protein
MVSQFVIAPQLKSLQCVNSPTNDIRAGYFLHVIQYNQFTCLAGPAIREEVC